MEDTEMKDVTYDFQGKAKATDKIILDFDNWTLAELQAFNQAQLTGDDAALDRLVAMLVVSWPFEQVPVSDLSMQNAGQVLRTINKEYQSLAQEEYKDKALFQIDLTGWRFRDFASFSRALNEFDRTALYDLVSRIIKSWPYEFELNAEAFDKLSVEQFHRLTGSIQFAVKDAFQGG